MRIGIIGAGGVGGLLAALLARAHHDVALLSRGDTLAAVRERGLRIESSLGEFAVDVETASTPRELGLVDVVILCVKAWQVADATKLIEPWLREGGIAVPLQNGVDAPDHLAAVLGVNRVIGGLAHMVSWVVEPGVVRHIGSPPRITLGSWRTPLRERCEALGHVLRDAGCNVEVTDDFEVALWRKFLFVASFGGIAAVKQSPAGVVRATEDSRRLLAAAFEEVRLLALARGVLLPKTAAADALALVDGLPPGATSSLQRDLAAGRPSELEALSGAVVRMGLEVGLALPVHAGIHEKLAAVGVSRGEAEG